MMTLLDTKHNWLLKFF